MIEDKLEISSEVGRRSYGQAIRIFYLQAGLNTFFIAVVQGLLFQALLKQLAVPNFYFGLAGFLAMIAGFSQIFSSTLVEKHLVRKPIITKLYRIRALTMLVGAVLLTLNSLGWGVSDQILTWSLLLLTFCAFLAFCISNPIWFSWATDLLPVKVKGSFFGRLQMVSQMVQASMLLSMGWVLQWLGERALWCHVFLWFAAAISQVVAGKVNRLVQEPTMKASPHGNHFFNNLKDLFHLRDYRLLLWVTCFNNFFILISCTFSAVYFRDILGLGWHVITVFGAIWTLGFGLSSPLWGMLLDRLGGARILLAIALGIQGLGACMNVFVQAHGLDLGLFMVSPSMMLSFLSGMGGISFGGVLVCLTHLQSEMTPQSNRTMLVGTFNAVASVASALGALLIGVCMEWPFLSKFSLHVGPLEINYFQLLAFIQGTNSVLLILMVLRIKALAEQSRVIISTVFGGGLFSGALAVWRIQHLTDEQKTTKMIDKSRKGGAMTLLLPDLLRRLDDPSSSVRNASIYAIGRSKEIGAVPDLLNHLHDPHYGHEIEVIWALGQIGDSRAEAPLTEMVQHKEVEVAKRAASALAQIHTGPENNQILLHYLESESRMPVFLALAETLLHKGCQEVIPCLLHNYAHTRVLHIRTQLALDIAHVCQCRREFYASCRAEEEQVGSAFDKLRLDKDLCALFADMDEDPDIQLLFSRTTARMKGRLSAIGQHLAEQWGERDWLDALLALHLVKATLSTEDKAETPFLPS